MSWRIIIITLILIINPYVDYAEWLISQESMLVCFCFIWVIQLVILHVLFFDEAMFLHTFFLQKQ